MTDHNIFLVTFDIQGHDDNLNDCIWDNFDITGIPQAFNNLDDAKVWIKDIVKNDIWDFDNTLVINPDIWHDTDIDDFLPIFGTGCGAIFPWLTVSDCGGAKVRFWIHKIDLQ